MRSDKKVAFGFERPRHREHGQAGFTAFELAVTIMILGVILAVSALSYGEINKGMRLSAAKKQVEEAINRAKTAARQENVTYRLKFYSSTEPYPDTYEFYCNAEAEDGSGWVLKPVDKSVSGEKVIVVEGEVTHWYIQVANGVKVVGNVEITITPAGTTLQVTPAEVVLRVGDSTGRISVDEVGRTTVQ